MTDYLQQPHAIDVLRTLHHIPNPQWKLVREYALGELGVSSLSDFCYRERCMEAVQLGLAKAVERDPLKNDYHLTEWGHEVAGIIEQALTRAERWRSCAKGEL